MAFEYENYYYKRLNSAHNFQISNQVNSVYNMCTTNRIEQTDHNFYYGYRMNFGIFVTKISIMQHDWSYAFVHVEDVRLSHFESLVILIILLISITLDSILQSHNAM